MQNPAELEQHFRHQVSGNAGLMSPLCMNGCRGEDTIQNATQPKRQSGLIGTGFNPLAQAPKGPLQSCRHPLGVSIFTAFANFDRCAFGFVLPIRPY